MKPVLRCEQVEERLSDYIEGGLDAGLHADMETHLVSCDACRALHDALREVIAALRSVAILEPPQDLAARAARSWGGSRIATLRSAAITSRRASWSARQASQETRCVSMSACRPASRPPSM